MKRITSRSLVAFGLLASSGIAIAKPGHDGPSPSDQALISGLNAIGQLVAHGQSQPISTQAPSTDRDQGDEHASDRAILVVCSHDNPSAQRSAICPQPNSPP